MVSFLEKIEKSKKSNKKKEYIIEELKKENQLPSITGYGTNKRIKSGLEKSCTHIVFC